MSSQPMHFRSLDPNRIKVSQTFMSQPCPRTMLSQVPRLFQSRAILSRRPNPTGYHRSLQPVHLSKRLFRVRQKGLSGSTLCLTFNQAGQRSMLSSVYQAPRIQSHADYLFISWCSVPSGRKILRGPLYHVPMYAKLNYGVSKTDLLNRMPPLSAKVGSRPMLSHLPGRGTGPTRPVGRYVHV